MLFPTLVIILGLSVPSYATNSNYLRDLRALKEQQSNDRRELRDQRYNRGRDPAEITIISQAGANAGAVGNSGPVVPLNNAASTANSLAGSTVNIDLGKSFRRNRVVPNINIINGATAGAGVQSAPQFPTNGGNPQVYPTLQHSNPPQFVDPQASLYSGSNSNANSGANVNFNQQRW